MLADLLVIRHGETEWNRQHRWQGHLDSPLTDLGQSQARLMGRMLGALGITAKTHAFHVSPLGRARQTLRLMLSEIGAVETVAQSDPDLAEIDVGGFTGWTQDRIHAQTNLPPGTHFFEHYSLAPDGESLEALWQRASRCVARLTGPTVLVTHGVTSRFLRAAALGQGAEAARDLPGGQGVIHRIQNGQHHEITAADLGLSL